MCWGRTASTESYLKEIVTFHIDRLMGFYRTPVVTPFYMSSKQLLEFAREVFNHRYTSKKSAGSMERMHAHEHHFDVARALGAKGQRHRQIHSNGHCTLRSRYARGCPWFARRLGAISSQVDPTVRFASSTIVSNECECQRLTERCG